MELVIAKRPTLITNFGDNLIDFIIQIYNQMKICVCVATSKTMRIKFVWWTELNEVDKRWKTFSNWMVYVYYETLCNFFFLYFEYFSVCYLSTTIILCNFVTFVISLFRWIDSLSFSFITSYKVTIVLFIQNPRWKITIKLQYNLLSIDTI